MFLGVSLRRIYVGRQRSTSATMVEKNALNDGFHHHLAFFPVS